MGKKNRKKFNETKVGKFFNNTALGKTLTSVAIGTISAVPYVGRGISDELRANKADTLTHTGLTDDNGIDTGEGKHNIWRWIAFSISALLFLGRLIFPEVVNAEFVANVTRLSVQAFELMN